MNHKRTFTTLLASVLAMIAAQASAATVTLTPDKDNSIIQTTDPNNQLSNALGDLFVGRTNQDGSGPAVISIRRGLVHFNVNSSTLPDGAVITGVSLTMRDQMGNNGDQTLSLETVSQDWGQGTSFFNGGVGAPATNNDATWLYSFYNAANPSASTTWGTPGGSFSGVVSASAVDLGASSGGGIVTWTSAQMVTDLQSWINNPSGNFGWAVLGNESTGMTAKRLNSSETANPPVLTITYNVVPEPSSVVLAAGALAGLVALARRRAK